MLHRTLTIIGFICCVQNLFSQGAIGLRTERWSGISAVHLNPANSTVFPKKWELQLGGAHVYFSTNYLFLNHTSIIDLAKHPEDIRLATTDSPSEGPMPSNPIIAEFPAGKKVSYGAVDLRVEGPAFAYHFGDRHTAGVFTGFRALTSGYSIPKTFGYTYLDLVPYDTEKKASALEVSGMAWSEIGAHYAYRTPDYGTHLHSFGVNVKFIQVKQAGYARINDDFKFTRGRNDTITLSGADWDIAYTNDIVNNYQNFSPDMIKTNGRGMGLDLGYNFLLADLEADSPDDYKLMVGAAITDLGFARINKNAEVHNIDFSNPMTITFNDLKGASTPEEAIKTISQLYLNDSLASYGRDEFTMYLPTRLNLNVDYKIADHFYLNGIFQQKVPFAKNSLKPPSLIAITPRFESRWFSAFLPVSLSDYRHVQFGTAVRLGVLTIGSDNVPSIVKATKWHGSDFYIQIKLNSSRLLSMKKVLRAKDRKWTRVGCYDL
jgi:hypothetical protein